jgi:hypothetical protein
MAVTTLKHWFDRFTEATGQEVTHILMHTESEWDWEYKVTRYSDADRPTNAPLLWNGVAERGQLFERHNIPKEILDYKFDDGYGSPDAPPIIAYSRDYIIYIHEYDGAEWPVWLPRFPVANIGKIL